MRACVEIAWVAIRELLHERVFYLLLAFAGLSLGVSALLGQMTYGEQQKLTMDFMLAGTQLSMSLFAIFMGISLLQRELTGGSIAVVLARPLPRWNFLVGKYLGQAVIQSGISVAMVGITVLFCSRFGPVAFLPLFQVALLNVMELAVLTAAAYFFAVNAGPLVAAVGGGCVFVLGHIREAVSTGVGEGMAVPGWRVLSAAIPDLELFNLKPLASYGLGLGATEMGWAAAYTVCCLTLFLVPACLCFQRRDLLT